MGNTNNVMKYIKLSKRKYEVFCGIVDGTTNKDIAKKLNVSVRTIESYVANLCYDMDCINRRDMIIKHHKGEMTIEVELESRTKKEKILAALSRNISASPHQISKLVGCSPAYVYMIKAKR